MGGAFSQGGKKFGAQISFLLNYCKLVLSEHLQIFETTDVYFVLYLECLCGFALLLYTVSCEFPHPNKIDHFTYMMETERQDDWVYFFDSPYQENIFFETIVFVALKTDNYFG